MKTIARRSSVPLAGRAVRYACECFAARTGNAFVPTSTAVPDPKQRSIPTNGKATTRSNEIGWPSATGRGNGHSGENGDGIREIHVNTIEGLWTGLRNFLRPFRGVHKKHLAGYVAICEFAINLKRITPSFISGLVRAHNF